MIETFRKQAEERARQFRRELRQSLAQAQTALLANDRDPEAYSRVAQYHQDLKQGDLAIAVLREGIQRCPPSVSLFRSYVWALSESNYTADAIAVAQQASLCFPDNFFFRMQEALLLPVLYRSAGEIEHFRRRYDEGLGRLENLLSLDTPKSRRDALEALGAFPNTNLPYQNRNDRDLLARYGNLAHRIMAAGYPDWVKPLPMPPAPPGEKVRIGYLSSRFRNLSAAKYFLGWLREHDRQRFDVYAYHVGTKTDAVTDEVRSISRRFHHFPDRESACQAILADRLHFLVFLDIGLKPITTQLASLRLAPVQCAAWDQPVTSGLSTVDFFLSSGLTEPENAQDHYSEALVRLPGVGVCYSKPVLPKALLSKTREDFQIPENAVVYLCCQLASKWLPSQDEIFVEIARRVPKAVFVFLAINQAVSDDLGRRLENAFSAAGLRAADHCVRLLEVDRFSYWNLTLLGDVFLDPIGWSGGVSTFEAIACPLAVVTMPGEFMRGRQSAAILTQLGVTDTIARNPAEYVEIAVRLGVDHPWRDAILLRMQEGAPALYGDTRSIRALEEFYRQTLRDRGALPPETD